MVAGHIPVLFNTRLTQQLINYIICIPSVCSASNMISDGSELLLLVPAVAGLVGSVVLPVLGAVPDGAIVLFSGLGDDAQEQLSVGVGALAGSTIMLLTIPWWGCFFVFVWCLGRLLSSWLCEPDVGQRTWCKQPLHYVTVLFYRKSGYYRECSVSSLLWLVRTRLI